MKIKRVFMKKFIFILMIFASFLLYGCENEKADTKKNEKIKSPKVKVVLYKVKKKTIRNAIEQIGTVMPEKEAGIGIKVPGVVKRVFVNESDYVKEGQKLLELDSTDLNLELQVALSTLKDAKNLFNLTLLKLKNLKKDYKRFKVLYEKKVIPQSKFDEIETTYKLTKIELESAKVKIEKAKASIDILKQKIKDTTVNAPFDGIIAKKWINEGETVAGIASKPLFFIINIDNVNIKVDIPDVRSNAIELNQKALIKVDSFPNTIYVGKVIEINPAVDFKTRTFPVKILAENRKHHLKPGMFCRVTIIIKEKKDVLACPINSIMKEDSKLYLFVYENGRVWKKYIKIGLKNQNSAEVLEGLKEGEQVVIDTNFSLKNGLEVMPVPTL